ncbi:MAG: copper oxidase (laccase) domain-containing protein, partial [Woeseiaceae bacterium]
ADSCFVRNGRGKWQADLYQLAQLRLAAAGVVDIYGGGLCTFNQSDRYFSYRRDGQCGRMASYIFREA